MPIYEYDCRKCGELFELLLGINEADGRQACPKCGSKRTKKVFSIFGFSSDRGASSSSCGGCTSSSCDGCSH